MLGLKQAGATDYRVLDLARHAPLLEIAKKDAESIVAKDPELAGSRGGALRLVRELLTPRLQAPTSE